MQRYVYVKSPMKAAQLLDQGFSYIKAPFNSNDSMFIFQFEDRLQKILQESFILGEDYVVREGALIAF